MYIVITGTSRGIGLELVRYALRKDYHVIAVARTPTESPDLVDLSKQFEKLQIVAVDINTKGALEIIKAAVSNWPRVDVLINNAGVYLRDESIEDFEKSFLTNSIMPLFITKTLSGKLERAVRPVTVQITSQMGSIHDNTSGGSYSYRASKTALNMLYKSLSVDEPWLISLLVHPGWVQTRMGGQGAPTSPDESAKGIWKIIDTATESQSGTFIDFRGKSLPW